MVGVISYQTDHIADHHQETDFSPQAGNPLQDLDLDRFFPPSVRSQSRSGSELTGFN
jgi:hypothetical protein